MTVEACMDARDRLFNELDDRLDEADPEDHETVYLRCINALAHSITDSVELDSATRSFAADCSDSDSRK